MGNIVSNAVVPNQPRPSQAAAAVSSPQAGVPPVQPEPGPTLPGTSSAEGSTPTPITIEGVGGAQPAGFNTDPFGPMPPPPEVPSTTESQNPPSITPEPLPPPAPKPPIEPVEKPASAAQGAAELLAKMPDIQQMMKDLEKSGCLLPELQIKSSRHIDSSPLAALQPKTLQDQSYFSSPSDEQPVKVLPDIQLGSTRGADHKGAPTELPLFVFVAMFGLVQSIQGLAMVAHFAFVKFPEFEQMIIANIITTSGVDAAVVKAIIVGIMAAVGLLFSLLILIKRSKNRSVDIYIVISIIVINFLVQNVLAQKVLASGNPLQLPDIIGEIMAHYKQ